MLVDLGDDEDDDLDEAATDDLARQRPGQDRGDAEPEG